ncbi:30S ribosome-binding factor RbfA [Cohaesibacter gelatinilyticus]|uniref:Ribosome-binding factor A n=1 Tax=Cohaesibacter gelatinilyticus TaxID=372072 RepID=A0A285PE09_9HYPH|nr:30S ribosome-binding factor RbfA [Cohaesibacter gelatinilyticus]SNZ19984.1 ribosome-binding factor A [Cohaesibacter gelatinilyticus]HAT85399.1 30S ribosome-binding factor RbfA [Hyphomicrobiales bacterium]
MSRKTRGGKGMPSQRQLRVGELVRKSISECLTRGEVQDELLQNNVISIPEVRVTPDMKLATAFVMPLGVPGMEKDIVEALNRHKKYLRGRLGRDLGMKHTPELRFRYDETFDEASRIDALLSSPKVIQDLQDRNDQAEEDE